MKCLNLIFLILCLMISACSSASLVMPTATLEATPTQWFPPTLTPSPASTPKPTETLTPPPSSATLRPTLSSMTTPTNSDLGKLAYVQGGDIWVKSLPTGQPQRLTTDGHHHEPRWSSSGQWLAFRTGESQVWVMRADGSAQHPSNESKSIKDFAWAPNVDGLAYTTDDGTLLAMNADGSDRQAFVMPDSRQPITGVESLAWSPDGQWLALTRGEILKEGAPSDRYDSVWRVRADGSEATELLNAGRPSDREFILAGWSSDSSAILLWINPGYSGSALADGVPLYALSVKGNSPIPLAANLDAGSAPRAKIVLTHSDFVAPAPANFDATHIALTVGDYRATWVNKRVGIVDVRTGQIRLLTPQDQAAFSPNWSPAGKRLAYVAMPDKGDLGGGEDARLGMMDRRIFTVNTQGDLQPRQLTDDPAYRDERPFWSADGSFILFARMNRENQASVWLVPAEGGEPRQIVDELTPAPEWFGYYGYIDWNDLFDWWRKPAMSASSPSVTIGDQQTEVITYTVQLGETIFGIAARFHLHAETILWANEETLAGNPHRIQPGVILNILPVDGVYYRWQTGDDLAKVAERFGVKPEDILNWPGNHLDLKNPTIQPGRLLIIPGGTQPLSTFLPDSSSAEWTADFTPTVAIAAMGNATRAEIVRTLFEQWLRHYETSRADDTYRLDDYEIHRIDLSQQWEELVNPGWLDFVADVAYSVKPSVFVYSHWNAGSAQTGDNGWVNTGILVGVFTKDGSYHLHILGSG